MKRVERVQGLRRSGAAGPHGRADYAGFNPDRPAHKCAACKKWIPTVDWFGHDCQEGSDDKHSE